MEVIFDQVTNDRFRHGTTLLRWPPETPDAAEAWLLSQSKATSVTKLPPSTVENRPRSEAEAETNAGSRSSPLTTPHLRP